MSTASVEVSTSLDPTIPYNPTKKEALHYNKVLNRPSLPVSPVQAVLKNKNPKQPFYYDGKYPVVLSWEPYQRWVEDFSPDVQEQLISTWHKDSKIDGVSTLGGWNGKHWLGWIDFDNDDFESPEAMQQALLDWINKYPNLKASPRFLTPRDGIRYLVAWENDPTKNGWGDNNGFAFEPDATDRLGELLTGNGGHTLLPPTKGTNGKAYRDWVNFGKYPPVVESPESIGLYIVKTAKGQKGAKLDKTVKTEKLEPRTKPELKAKSDHKPDDFDESLSRRAFLDEVVFPVLVSTPDKLFGHQRGWKGAGKNAWCDLCVTPEKGPSFSVSPDEPVCKCFGCWTEGGSFLDYFMIKKGLKQDDYAKAVDQLAEVAGTESYKEWWGKKNSKPSQARKSPARKIRTEEQCEGDDLESNVWKCPDELNYEYGYWKELKGVEFESEDDIPESLTGPNYKAVPTTVKVPILDETGQPTGKTRNAEGVKIYHFDSLTDFVFTVDRVLESSDGGGLELRIERLQAGQLTFAKAMIASKNTAKVIDFATNLKEELGTNVSCLLKIEDLQRLLHVKTEEYRRNGGRTYKRIDYFGIQEDGTWVFDNIQNTVDGRITTEEESGWVSNPRIGIEEKIRSPKMLPPDPTALPNLVKAVKGFFPEKAIPHVWFALGWATMQAHYKKVFEDEGFFPPYSSYGDKGGGKSTKLKIIGSVFGISSLITKYTESMIWEYVSRYSGIPVLLDDPIPSGRQAPIIKDQLDTLVWKIRDGHSRMVRGNCQQPRTSVGVGTNVALAGDNAAVDTRLIKDSMPVGLEFNEKGHQALSAAMKAAAGGFYQLISFKYDRTAVNEIELKLLPNLPNSHRRIARNLALITYFTDKFCEIAGVRFNAIDQCIKILCPEADSLGTSRDSLADFIDQVKWLKSEGHLGEYCCVPVEPAGSNEKFIAIYTQPVWDLIQSRSNPNYNLQTLKGLIEAQGGMTRRKDGKSCVAKFVSDQRVWEQYVKALANYDLYKNSTSGHLDRPEKPKRDTPRKCILIPARLFEEDVEESCSTDAVVSQPNKKEDASLEIKQPYEPRGWYGLEITEEDREDGRRKSPAQSQQQPSPQTIQEPVQAEYVQASVVHHSQIQSTELTEASNGKEIIKRGDRVRYSGGNPDLAKKYGLHGEWLTVEKITIDKDRLIFIGCKSKSVKWEGPWPIKSVSLLKAESPTKSADISQEGFF